MNRFRQQLLNERLQQRMDARSQAPQVAEVHAVIPDLSFAAPPCLTLLGQERFPRTFARLAMLSLILSLGLAACSPAEASPTAVSPAPQVTLEPTFTPTFVPTFTPVPPATLEASPNAPATQEAFLQDKVEALVQSGITAEKSGEGWILSTTDANAQRVELGEIQKVGDSYKLVFTTMEGNPASENLAMVNYDKTSSSWVISEPEHHWPVFHLTEQGWEQLLFRIDPTWHKLADEKGEALFGVLETSFASESRFFVYLFGFLQKKPFIESPPYQNQLIHYRLLFPFGSKNSGWGFPVDFSTTSQPFIITVVHGYTFDMPEFNPNTSASGITFTADNIDSIEVFPGEPAYAGFFVNRDLVKFLEEKSQPPYSLDLAKKYVRDHQGSCSDAQSCADFLKAHGLVDDFLETSTGMISSELLEKIQTMINTGEVMQKKMEIPFHVYIGIGRP